MLADYTVEFFRVPLFGTWTYRITAPDGRTLRPFPAFGFMERDAAERAALRQMKLDADRETMTAGELLAKLDRADG